MEKEILKNFEREKKQFSIHYEQPIVSPQLRWNSKYRTPEMEGYTPIIAIRDLVDYHYVVCAIPNEEVEFMLMQLNRTPVVVAQYNTLDEMVLDGWRMGS